MMLYLFSCLSVLCGVSPYVAAQLRPPLGQLPGLSFLVNITLCFAYRFIFATALVTILTYLENSRKGKQTFFFLSVSVVLYHNNGHDYRSCFLFLMINKYGSFPCDLIFTTHE